MKLFLIATAETAAESLETFVAAPHDDVLRLLIHFIVLLACARLLGELAQRFGQSSVIGEIMAGILLGPSFIGELFPFLENWLIPQTPVDGYLLEEISMIGIIFLLLITGLETDLGLIRRQARSALGVALGGLSITLTMGFLVGQIIPENLLISPDDRLVFALFLAISMAISAIPVIAKVLMDLNLTRRDVGQTIIACAMIDDTVGWILLSIVIGMAEGSGATLGGIATSIGSVLLFILFSFTVGQWLVRNSLRFVQNQIRSRDKTLTLIVLFTFTWGAITHALHLEALLGAFVMGILFSRLPSLDGDVVHTLESIALGIFAPVFFATAGLKVNIITILEPDLIAITALITITAIIFKVSGVYLGARFIGKRDHWSALFLGMGLNARGSMGIIVATIGIEVGVLSQETFTMIVLMAVITSLIAPAALRWTLGHIESGDEELSRLRREEMNKDNIIANAHRVLLPIRPRETEHTTLNQVVEARILHEMSKSTDMAVTLFTINSDPQQNDGIPFLDKMGKLFSDMTVTKRVVNALGRDPGDIILDEVQKDYDLLVIGASEGGDGRTLFNPVADYLVRLAPCPTIVIRGANIDEEWRPRRILVPTGGSAAARSAAQVGFALTSDEVIVLSVIEKRHIETYSPDDTSWETRQISMLQRVVGELRDMGEMLGKNTTSVIRRGEDTTQEILRVAREENVDLIIIGTQIRAGSDHLYLGPRVERLLKNARCPVMIVNSE